MGKKISQKEKKAISPVEEKLKNKNDRKIKPFKCGCFGGCSNGGILKTFVFLLIGVIIGFIIGYQSETKEKVLPEREVIDNQLSIDEVGQRVIDFIVPQLPEGVIASVAEVISERGLYKMIMTIQGEGLDGVQAQEIMIYLTKDGALLFPEVINLEEVKKRQEEVKEGQMEGIKCAEFQSKLTPERKEKIAKCLTEKGFRVYIADWCPFCRQQKEFFGEAAKHLTSIDCYDPEHPRRGNIAKCPDLAGVPVWKDKDDNIIAGGMIQIRRLVEASGCDF